MAHPESTHVVTPFWRDTLSFDTYCGPCYLAHLRDGVIEDTFEPYYGPADFCDACLEGFSG